jgi:transposase
MKGVIVLQSQEKKRVYVLQQVVQGKMTAAQAAAVLGLAKRQVFRLKKKLQKQGVASLAHRNLGRRPPNAVSSEVRERIISLAQGDYSKASCEHMAELLAQREGIILSSKTIGRILKAAQIVNLHSHRAARRRRSRDRKPQEGMLSQCDASPHAWLESRGPVMSLHGSIDDATGKVQGLDFRLHEDTMGYLKMLEQVVTQFGVPEALYSDRHTIFFSPKTEKLSIEEQLAGMKAALTQFGHALQQLKIRHIPARSPQAKGRAERLWGTLQHRLVIELRLAGVCTMEQANAFLPGFINYFNARFSVAAKETKTAYLPCPSRQGLDRILCQRYFRTASQGSTIAFEGQRYLLIDSKGKVALLRPGHKVVVMKHLDGAQSGSYNERRYALKVLDRPKPVSQSPKIAPQEKSTKPIITPPKNHPWKTAFSLKRILEEKQNRGLF